MSSYVLFLLLGLGSGATYPILGQGLVLKYRSGGIVDFAHGAIAMFSHTCSSTSAGVGSSTSADGPAAPITISATGLPTALAIVISLIYSAILGAVLYY